MRLKNIVIVVRDIRKSVQFYHDLFGLDVVLDGGGNVILTEGLVLQDREIWAQALGMDVTANCNSCELYFEERQIEAFAERLERMYPAARYVSRLAEQEKGQRKLRFYDPDGHLIEVGEP